MERRVSPIIRDLLEERRLVRARLGKKAVEEEQRGAEYDLEKARKSLEEGDFKWATVKSYYSMFHAARALLYKAGYREKSHRALVSALRELYTSPGMLKEEALSDFENVMDLREEADYALKFSENGARRSVRDAERFLVTARVILRSRLGKIRD